MLVKKNIIIMHPTDKGACAFYRCHFMADILRSQLGGEVEPLVTPAEITDDYILAHTAAIVVYRPINDYHQTLIRNYGNKKKKFKYKIFADFDDLIFSVNNQSLIPDYNMCGIDPNNANYVIRESLKYLDGVTVSTRVLASIFGSEFGKVYPFVHVLPNAVPRYLFGQKKRKPLKKDIAKPIVLYAGSMTHFSNDCAGDFNGPWIPWLEKAISQDSIEFHCFGDIPSINQGSILNKIVTHEFVSAIEFPSVVSSIGADIYIAPLKANNFNQAKSNLKFIEACAIGAAFIGSDFTFSPYGEACPICRVSPVDDELDIDRIVRKVCEKDVYNGIIDIQYKILEQKNYWMDSEGYIDKWLKTYFGELITKEVE